jgi:hypothetical protein
MDVKRLAQVAAGKVAAANGPPPRRYLDHLRRNLMSLLCKGEKLEEVQKDERTGKSMPVKIGLKPIFREGADDHIATASKDRTGLFDGKHFTPDKATGLTLLEWLETGVDADAAALEAVKTMIERIGKIENMFELRNWWKKHQPEIEALKLVDRTLVVNAKDARKTELEKGEQAGNGKKQEVGG